MKMIGEWRAVLRSTYIRWAMAINGLHVAAAKYRVDNGTKEFVVSSIRADSARAGQQEAIAKYTFEAAADFHLKIQPMLCAHGFIDMYAGLEEMVFAFYKTFWKAVPDGLLVGRQFKELKKLRIVACENGEEKTRWETALDERIDAWQRKKLYEGLDKVSLAFCESTGLKTPVGYKVSSPKTWSESIAGIHLSEIF